MTHKVVTDEGEINSVIAFKKRALVSRVLSIVRAEPRSDTAKAPLDETRVELDKDKIVRIINDLRDRAQLNARRTTQTVGCDLTLQGWMKRTVLRVRHLANCGFLHSYSGTSAIDGEFCAVNETGTIRR